MSEIEVKLSNSNKVVSAQAESQREKSAKAEQANDTDLLPQTVREIDGPKGPEPTRFGDWFVNGRCTDF